MRELRLEVVVDGLHPGQFEGQPALANTAYTGESE
jgi:hypothetical protein